MQLGIPRMSHLNSPFKSLLSCRGAIESNKDIREHRNHPKQTCLFYWMYELKTFVQIVPEEARFMMEATGSRLKCSAVFSGFIINRFARAPGLMKNGEPVSADPPMADRRMAAGSVL
jgi:hypothetical protein